MQLDAVLVLMEPVATGCIEPMAGTVIEDNEDLATAIATHEQLQKDMERVSVEDRRELIGESSVIERDCAVNMSRLSEAECVHSRLNADAAPRLMERTVEPEARLVFEDDYASTGARFFLIAGNVFFSHIACFARSARASRLRGRCTENPS